MEKFQLPSDGDYVQVQDALACIRWQEVGEMLLPASAGHRLRVTPSCSMPVGIHEGFFSGSKLTETCVHRKECGKIMRARQSRLFRPPHLLTCKFWACVVVKHPMPWKTQKFCPQVTHDLRLDCVSVCVGHRLWEHKGQTRNIIVKELILDQSTFTQCREGKSDLWKQLLLQLYRWLCAEG